MVARGEICVWFGKRNMGRCVVGSYGGVSEGQDTNVNMKDMNKKNMIY